MNDEINTDKVTSASLPPAEMTTSTVGQWHNWGLYNHYRMVEQLNGDDSVAGYLKFSLDYTQKLRALELVPEKAAEFIERPFSILANAPDDSDFAAIIAQLREFNEIVVTDAALRNTMVEAAANIAYYSSQFWAEVTIGKSHASLRIPVWIKILCADIRGAIGGSAFGIPGEIIGGAAASIAAAP